MKNSFVRVVTIVLLNSLFLFSGKIFAQLNQNITPVQFPQAPNVASLIKYAEIPVDMYNGSTKYGIPIYEIQEGDLTLPISLNYSSNGLKVEEEASWVGLGWSLNAGGVIQMIPRGFDDLNIALAPLQANIDPNPDPNFDYSYSDHATNMIQNGCQYKNRQGEIVYMNMALGGGGQSNMSDGLFDLNTGYLYDMYLYNFSGYSGKFIDDNNGNFIDLEHSNTKFERTVEGGILCTTPDGNRYFFNVKATNQTQEQRGAVLNYTYYLSQIKSVNDFEVNFTYRFNKTESNPRLTQTRTKKLGNTDTSVNTTFSVSKELINEYVLQEITTSLTRVKFVEGALREDIYSHYDNSYFKSRLLERIEVYQQNSLTPLKNIVFSYDYFVGNPVFGDFTILPWQLLGEGVLATNTPTSIANKSKRLKLTGVRFDGTTFAPGYFFEYNPQSIPYKTSLAQDLWGYFNGISNYSFLPDLTNLGYYDVALPDYFLANPGPANRKSNEQFMKAGILTKVRQPAGGFTEIDYEINQFGALPSTIPNTSLVEKIATDYNSTQKQSVEFTIPNLGANNVQKISVTLVCNQYSTCEEDDTPNFCLPFSLPGTIQELPNNIHPTDNRIYALLERKVGTTWELVEIYSNNSQDLINSGALTGVCGVYNKAYSLPHGTYRITANFPDGRTDGQLGGPWSQIKIQYFEQNTNTYPNFGAGLRVKKVTDYSAENNKCSVKQYTYRNGLLLTKPRFYMHQSYLELVSIFQPASPPCLGNIEVYPINSPSAYSNPFDWGINSDYATLNSHSTSPYSYAANGSLVGYGEIEVLYGENLLGEPTKFSGREIYKYKNEQDRRMEFKSTLPGIPGGRILGIGSLVEKRTDKVLNPGQLGTAYFTVKKEVMEYELRDLKIYWAFRSNYVWPGYTIGEIYYSTRFNYLHFFPIKAGVFQLKKSIITEFSESQNIQNESVVFYTYNTKHQLISERTISSSNENIEKKSYFPNDLSSYPEDSGISTLIHQNRISTPVKEELLRNNQIVNQSETKFLLSPATGYKLQATAIFEKKGNGQINILSDVDKKIEFTRYDDKGRLLEYVENTGKVTSIIWGYNKNYIVARIENLAYNLIPQQLIQNIENTSAINDEASLLEQLSTLRSHSALANAMVTTFTYKPLIGVSTITDAKGDKITYEYDHLERLYQIKDKNGNILSENLYNYRTQN